VHPGRMTAGAESAHDLPYEAEILTRVDRPTQITELLITDKSHRPEPVQVSSDRQRHVLSFVGVLGLGGDARESVRREHLDIEPVGKCPRFDVACIRTIWSAKEEASHLIHNRRIDERAVSRHSHEGAGTVLSRADEPGENVVPRAAGDIASDRSRKAFDRIVDRFAARGNNNALNLDGAFQAPDEQCEHRLARDIRHRLTGKPCRRHARLDDRDNPCHW
jgi:hypothetical protein